MQNGQREGRDQKYWLLVEKISEEDRRVIEESLSDFLILGHMSYNPRVLQADREGRSPYDMDGQIKEEVGAILTELERRV